MAISEPISRREAMQRVTVLLGGVALVDGERVRAAMADAASVEAAQETTAAQGVGTFTAADVALLDEIAETILPETSTPGAKAAKIGAFMALMVTEAYDARQAAGVSAGPAATRRGVPQGARRPVHAGARRPATVARGSARSRAACGDGRSRRQADARARRRAPQTDEPAHYFRLMKELALLGYFTSEIGYTQAMRYSRIARTLRSRARRTRQATRSGRHTPDRRGS